MWLRTSWKAKKRNVGHIMVEGGMSKDEAAGRQGTYKAEGAGCQGMYKAKGAGRQGMHEGAGRQGMYKAKGAGRQGMYCHIHPHLLDHLLQLLVKAGLLVAHPGLGHLSVRYLE